MQRHEHNLILLNTDQDYQEEGSQLGQDILGVSDKVVREDVNRINHFF